MAALVVTVSPANGLGVREGRIGIFPGGATTTMYPANTAFWVGYGFAADAASGRPRRRDLTVRARRGRRARLDAHRRGHRYRSSRCPYWTSQSPPAGLPAGWHDFAGRWYDGGRLILSSRAAIQFVER